MDVKIVCGCGQKYIFEVDPDNGLMGTSVNCPACGADGTQEASEILAQIFPEPALEAVPPPTAAAAAGPIRVNLPVRPPMAASPPPPAPMASTAGEPPLPSAPRPITSVRSPALAAASKPKAEEECNLMLGVLGAILGAALGAGLMYGFFLLTDARFPLMGTGIGALSGLGARILARGTDTSLGVIAALVALLSTAGTLYLMFGDMAGMFVISMVVSVTFAYKIAG
ncbi:MAG: hypothetical protein ABSF60_09770 [Verrucomicrobiota bacterium]|jgi:hypothetical protein